MNQSEATLKRIVEMAEEIRCKAYEEDDEEAATTLESRMYRRALEFFANKVEPLNEADREIAKEALKVSMWTFKRIG